MTDGPDLFSEDGAARRLRLALRASGIGIWEWHLPSNRLFWDQRMYELYEVDPASAEDVYSMWASRVHPEDLETAEHEIELALTGEKAFFTEFRIVLPDGQTRHIRATGDVVFDRDGTPLLMTGANWDITWKRENLQIVRSAMDDLEQSNRRLEDFAFSVAHNLKTPLRHVTTHTQILGECVEDLPGFDGGSSIEALTRSAARMERLIADLLAFSRLDGRTVKRERFSPAEMFDHLLESRRRDIYEKSARIDIGRVPPVMEADRSQITQLFSQLLDNALKYADNGRFPEIRIRGSEEEAGWRYQVADNGIGIGKQHFERIFEPFKRLHSSDKIEGTGLGLAICRRIVDAHLGDIRVESRQGHGSTFHVSIRRPPGAMAA